MVQNKPTKALTSTPLCTYVVLPLVQLSYLTSTTSPEATTIGTLHDAVHAMVRVRVLK